MISRPSDKLDLFAIRVNGVAAWRTLDRLRVALVDDALKVDVAQPARRLADPVVEPFVIVPGVPVALAVRFHRLHRDQEIVNAAQISHPARRVQVEPDPEPAPENVAERRVLAERVLAARQHHEVWVVQAEFSLLAMST